MTARLIKEKIILGLRPAFTYERAVCRLLAAFVLSAAFLLCLGSPYSDLAFAQAVSLPVLGLLMLGLFAALSAVSILLPRYESDSWFLLGGATAAAVTWILSYAGGKNRILVTLAVLLAYAFFLLYVLKKNAPLLDRFTPGKRTVLILTLLMGIASAALIAALTCLRYATFSSPNFDFGLFVNMFHHMKETGLPLASSERDGLLSHFAVHISPIYYLLLPFYALFPSPLTLQIGQAVVLGSGVIPVLLLGRRLGLSHKAQLAFALLYSFFPAISAGCFYDLHENCFLAPLLLWVFYFFESERYLPMYLSAVLVLAVKEDAAIYLLIFALFLLLSRRKPLHGAILGALSLAYFFLALHLLNTYGDGAMVNRFDNLIFDKDAGLIGALKTLLVNPGYFLTQLFTTSANGYEKLVYLIQMLLPLAALPLITGRPSRLLLLAPILVNLLTYYPYQYDIGFQYSFGVTAFLVYAAMGNLRELKGPALRPLLALAISATMALYLSVFAPSFAYYTEAYRTNRETYAKMEEILDTIPEDASLNVTTFLLPHVADRDLVYETTYHGNKADVDFVVLDLRYSDASTRACRASYERQGYTVWADYDGLILILQKP